MKKHQNKSDEKLLKEISDLRQRIDELEMADHTHIDSGNSSLYSGKDYFQTLIENSTDMISILNQDGTIRYVNPATEQISGYKLEELIGKNAFDFVHPDELSNVADIFETGVKTPGYAVSIENRLQRKNGTWIDVEFSGTNLMDNPLVEGIMLNCRDISDRKQAEQRIKNSEERFRAIFENANDGIIQVSVDGTIIDINERLEKIFGNNREEIVGKKFTEVPFLNAHTMSDISDKFDSTAKTGKGSGFIEFEGLRKDGDTVFVQASTSIVKQGEKEAGLLAIVRDISQQKADDERISHLNAVLRGIRNVNQLIVGEKERLRLIQGACVNLVETRGYNSAWIVIFDEVGMISASAEAGLGDQFGLVVDQMNQGTLPVCVQQSLDQAQMIIIDDWVSTCDDCPLYSSNASSGGLTSRLEHEGKTYGVLSVSVPVNMANDEEEQSLFQEVVDDIAFALYRLDIEYERNLAEELLLESEEKYRLLIESTNDLVYIVNPEGIVTYVGPQVKNYGYTPDEIISKSMLEFIDPEDIEKVTHEFMDSMKSGAEFPAEFRLVDRHGNRYWVEDRGRVQHDECGNIIGLTGMLRDITERKKADQNLKQSKVITDNIDEALVVFNMDGTASFVNPAYEKITGRVADEIMGKSGAEIAKKTVVKHDVKRIQETLAKALSGEELPSILTHLKHKDGREIPVEFTASFVKDEQRERIQLVAVISDISERRQAEQALRESESKFRTIFETVNDEILYLDHSGVIIDTNSRVEDIFGYKTEEIIGKNFAEIGFIKSQHFPTMSQQFTEMVKGERERGLTHLEITHKTGRTVFVEASVGHIMRGDEIEGLIIVARDVTERNLAVEAIRKREAEYSSLVELSPDGIIVIRGTEIIFMNEKAGEIFSYPISKWIGRNVIKLLIPNLPDLLKPAEKNELITSMSHSIEENAELRSYTVPIMNGDGDTLWIEINASPAEFRGESVRIVFMRDITERKQWEAVLQDSEDKFRAIFENANDEIVYIDNNGIIVDRNIKGDDITGYTLDEVIGKNIIELANVLPEKEMVKMSEALKNATEGSGGPGLIEVELIHKNGSMVLVEASIGLLKRAGEIEGILVILRDITQRKQAQEQILRHNRELAALNAIAQTVTQSIDLDEILNSALNKTLDILNIKHGGILLLQEKENSLTFNIVKGISSEDITAISPNEIAQSDLWAAAENREPVFIESLSDNIGTVHVIGGKIVANHQLKSAMFIPLKTRGRVLGVIGAATQGVRVFTSEEQDLLITIGHQISTAIENAQLIEDASRAVALEETDRLRTAFLASVSHEMRTPMTSIKGLASTLVQPDVERDSKTQQDFLVTIDQESDRLLRIVSDVLDMSKIEAGAMKLEKSVTNLNRVISQLSSVFDNLAGDHPLEFVFPPELPSMLMDEVRIGQVITNLVENAASYSPEGTSITIEASESNGILETSVKDCGEGILPEHHEKVFNLFYRLEENVKRRLSGSGLGLAICKGIVESHGGKIWIESESGNGSKFIFTIPIVDDLDEIV